MKRFLLAALVILAFAAPASALAANCSLTVPCAAGAGWGPQNNFGVTGWVEATTMGVSNSSVYGQANTIYATHGTYYIMAGIGIGPPYAADANGGNYDFFIHSVGPNGTNNYIYTGGTWSLNTYYGASIAYKGTNQWSVTVGPFSKTIANNGMAGAATGLGSELWDSDPCSPAITNTTTLEWWNDVGGAGILTDGFPYGSLFVTPGTHGSTPQWGNYPKDDWLQVLQAGC